MPDQDQPNRPLRGTELKQIIKNDIEFILDQDQMLASHISYNRAAYEITVKIMTGNPIIPSWSNSTASIRATTQQIEANPGTAAIEAFPLEETGNEDEELVPVGVVFNREIISPTQSRIENGLPVPVVIRDQDGNVVEKNIMYDVDMLPENAYPDAVTIRELSPAEAKTKKK